MINFYKYHGAGNDFILIDNRNAVFKGDKVSFAKKWCDRRFGIGSDGLIFIEESAEVDFIMDFYNPDGSQSFCGNGSRCAVAFADNLEMIVANKCIFEAIDGIHEATLKGNQIKIQMKDVNDVVEIGVDYFIHTGSPHYISYCAQNDDRDIVTYGREIRYSENFEQEGTNVNLVEELNQKSIRIRTYERGVENETFACGTGATAAALSLAFKNHSSEGIIDVAVKGGDLSVHFVQENGSFSNVFLEGPAEYVFKGEIDA
jgi:diaminopimelate epimerase